MPHHVNLTYWGKVMNEQELVGYSVYVGIDWADSKHDVCIQSATSDMREFAVIRHRAEAIDAWVRDLQQRYGGTIAVAVEIRSSANAIERLLWRKQTLRIEISEAIVWSCIVSVDCSIKTGCPLLERVKFVARLLDDEKEPNHCNYSSDRIFCHPSNANHKEGCTQREVMWS